MHICGYVCGVLRVRHHGDSVAVLHAARQGLHARELLRIMVRTRTGTPQGRGRHAHGIPPVAPQPAAAPAAAQPRGAQTASASHACNRGECRVSHCSNRSSTVGERLIKVFVAARTLCPWQDVHVACVLFHMLAKVQQQCPLGKRPGGGKRRRHVVPSSCSWLMHSGSSPFDAAAGVQAVVERHFGLLCCATRGPARNF